MLKRHSWSEASPEETRRLTGAFVHACSTDDFDGIVRLLEADAMLGSDGGGKAKAALAPVRGPAGSPGSSWA